MLLVVGHPSIGAALETLLRIEDRYELRRAQSLEQAVAASDGWTADLAVVDGVLAQTGRTEVLAMPAIVLSGNSADGKRLSARFPDGRGWLRKDATAEELRVGIDRALARTKDAQGGARTLIVPGAIALAVLLIALAWYLIGVRG